MKLQFKTPYHRIIASATNNEIVAQKEILEPTYMLHAGPTSGKTHLLLMLQSIGIYDVIDTDNVAKFLAVTEKDFADKYKLVGEFWRLGQLNGYTEAEINKFGSECYAAVGSMTMKWAQEAKAGNKGWPFVLTNLYSPDFVATFKEPYLVNGKIPLSCYRTRTVSLYQMFQKRDPDTGISMEACKNWIYDWLAACHQGMFVNSFSLTSGVKPLFLSDLIVLPNALTNGMREGANE